jgi:hypothetical protein
LVSQSVSQHAPRPVQPRLHRLLADSKESRSLLRGHLLDVTHYEDGADRLRQIIDSSLQQYSNLVLSSCALGVLVWSDHRRAIDLHICAISRHIDDIKVDCASPPPPLQRLTNPENAFFEAWRHPGESGRLAVAARF